MIVVFRSQVFRLSVRQADQSVVKPLEILLFKIYSEIQEVSYIEPYPDPMDRLFTTTKKDNADRLTETRTNIACNIFV